MDMLLLGLIALVIGFFAAILGIGGAVAMTPTLILLGVETHIAMSVSLAGVALTSLVSSLEYIRQKVADLKLSALIMIVSIPGAFIGANLAIDTPGEELEGMLAVFLLVLAAIVLLDMRINLKDHFLTMERDLETSDGQRFSYRAQLAVLIPLGALSGVVAGFFGIGGGPLIVPSLLLSSIPAQVAVATSSVIVNASADVSFLAYLARGEFDLSYILPIAPALMIGSYVGARIAGRVKPSHTRLLLFCVLTLLSAMLLLR